MEGTEHIFMSFCCKAQESARCCNFRRRTMGKFLSISRALSLSRKTFPSTFYSRALIRNAERKRRAPAWQFSTQSSNKPHLKKLHVAPSAIGQLVMQVSCKIFILELFNCSIIGSFEFGRFRLLSPCWPGGWMPRN